MNKQIFSLLLITFILSSVSAIYAGESFVIDIGQDYDYYSIIGNSSEVVLDIVQNGTTLTITPNKYSLDDTYEIAFFNKEKETITVYTGGGGSGSGSGSIIRYVDKNVTAYKDKIVEVTVPGEEKIIEVSAKKNGLNIIIACLFLVLIILILWNIRKTKKKEPMIENYDYNYRIDKGGENQDE